MATSSQGAAVQLSAASLEQPDAERADSREDEPDALDEAHRAAVLAGVSVCRASVDVVQVKLPAPKPMNADHNRVTVVRDHTSPSQVRRETGCPAPRETPQRGC